MSIILPNIPSELSAASTAGLAAAKVIDNYCAQALMLYNLCLDEIKKLIFPCDIGTRGYPQIVVSSVIKSLVEAGYKAHRCSKEVILDYQGTDTIVFITINNPFIK